MTQKPKYVILDKPGKWILETEDSCKFRKKIGEEETAYRFVETIHYDDDGYYKVTDMTIDLLEYDIKRVEWAFGLFGIRKPDIRKWIKEQNKVSFKRIFHILYEFFSYEHEEPKIYMNFNDVRKRVGTLVRADMALNGEGRLKVVE